MRIGATLVDVVCAQAPGDQDSALVVVGPLGAPAADLGPLAELLAAQGRTVTIVPVPADARAAGDVLAQVLAGLDELARARGPADACGRKPRRKQRCCTGPTGRQCDAPDRWMEPTGYRPDPLITIGTGASAAAFARRACRTFGANTLDTWFVDPILTPEAGTYLRECLGTDWPWIQMLVSSCPGTLAGAEEIRERTLHQKDQMGLRQAPECVRAPAPLAPLGEAGWKQLALREGPALGVRVIAPPHEVYEELNISLVAGYGGGNGSGLLGAVRPEWTWLRHGSTTTGLGVHGLIGALPGAPETVVIGGGGDAVLSLSRTPSMTDTVLQPALGLYYAGHLTASAGFLLGFREAAPRLGHSEIPFGIRVDLWVDVQEPALRSVTVSVELDIFAFALLGSFL